MRGKLEDMRNNLKVNGNCSEVSKLQVNNNSTASIVNKFPRFVICVFSVYITITMVMNVVLNNRIYTYPWKD